MITIDIPPNLKSILDAVRAAGGRPMIVGGAVRDAAFGLPVKDFDIEVYAIETAQLVDALETVGKVNQVGRSFGVLKVTLDGKDFDVSLPRRESKSGRGHRGFQIEPDASMTPKQAAERRDFTVNAMAYDPATGEVLDFFGGMRDLEDCVLRHTSAAFVEDPLRVLRGMQFAGRFRMKAAPETVELSSRLFDEYDTLAIERIWVEWYKWAARSAAPSMGLSYLRECGWWQAYPEIKALDGCPQDAEWHPEGDVWVHTLLVVDAAARVAERDQLVADDRAALVLAALCHDLGKPETTFVENSHVRSPGHTASRETFERFLQRVGCPQQIALRILALSRHHMSHMGFTGSKRHVRRLSRSLDEEGGETIEMLARLVEADHSSRPPLPGGMPDAMRRMLDEAEALALAATAPAPLLKGRDLMEMGIAAGPGMGKILRAAYEAQIDGAFQTVEEAKVWVRRHQGV